LEDPLKPPCDASPKAIHAASEYFQAHRPFHEDGPGWTVDAVAAFAESYREDERKEDAVARTMAEVDRIEKARENAALRQVIKNAHARYEPGHQLGDRARACAFCEWWQRVLAPDPSIESGGLA
jgi:hypothetical protein